MSQFRSSTSVDPSRDTLKGLQGLKKINKKISPAKKSKQSKSQEISDSKKIKYITKKVKAFIKTAKGNKSRPSQVTLLNRYIDNYVSGDVIGKGSTCVVRKCKRIADNKEFAVKIINKNSLNKRDLAFVKREITVLKKLKNTEGVIHLENMYENETYLYIILELCTGKDLFSYIETHNTTKNGKVTHDKDYNIDEKHIAFIFYQICKAIHLCHKKHVVHRDLKPENILLKNNKNLEIKLSDFGLSYNFDANHSGGKYMLTKCGSPCTVAPEVIDNKYYTSKADWWSCGVILYMLLSGTFPFYNSNLQTLYQCIIKGRYSLSGVRWTKISAEAKDLVSKLLVRNPNERFTYRQIMKHSFMQKNLVYGN